MSKYKHKTKKTIIIVANSTWNIRNFRLNVISELLRLDYNIVVIAPIDDYISYLDNFPQIKHYNLPRLSRKGKNPVEDFLLFGQLLKMYRKIKPDMILHYTIKPNIYGSFASHLCRIPTISFITGLGYAFIHNGIVSKIVRRLYRLAFRFNEKVFFENIDDRILFIKEGIIRSSQGISTKGCGVDIDYFQPLSPMLKRNTIIFSFIGRLLYDKGISEFVHAAEILKKKYSHLEFQIIGETDKDNPASIHKADLLRWVEAKTVHYRGFHSDVRDIIDRSDCIVLPSYREAIARTLTEAMSMARPIITTDTAGCREAVEEGKNGYLVKLRNAESLANAMEKFALLPIESKRKMGDYGRKKAVAEFDDRVIAKQIVSVIEEVLYKKNKKKQLCKI